MEASVAIQVLPLGKEKESVLNIVDEVIYRIEKSGLNYEVGPFETTVEGDLDTLMDLIKDIQKIAISAGADELATYIKLFYRPEGGVLTIHEKVDKHRK
ncbi:MAG: thiamine-binding protein [Tissierellia bacterium]|nr:thiamine-binding protein [Tissierellia bacterium]